MGQAVAARLMGGGHDVVVWNRSPGKAGKVVAAGGWEAHSIAEAVSGREVVVTSLANDDAVRGVALGDGGIRSAIGPEAVYADCSTVSRSPTPDHRWITAGIGNRQAGRG